MGLLKLALKFVAAIAPKIDPVLKSTLQDVKASLEDPGVNVIELTDGDDSLHGPGAGEVIKAGAGDDTVNGGNGDDTVLGGSGDDSLLGANGDDVLIGGRGDDTTSGGPGSDTIIGGSGNDDLAAGGGDDFIYGTLGADVLQGIAGNDFLSGGFGNDTLIGGDGTDTLVGGHGNDVLRGDDGAQANADLFRFSGLFWGNDTIEKFQDGLDLIELSGVLGVNDFGDLNITDTAGGALVTYGLSSILLKDVNATALDAGDFLFT